MRAPLIGIKRIVWSLIVCVCGLAPRLSCHAEQPAVAEFITRIETESCADQGAWLKPYNISPSECGSIMRGIVSQCVTRALSSKSIPLQTEAELKEASEGIYDCMKQTFLSRHGGSANAAGK